MAKQEIEFEVTLEKLSFKFKGSQEMGQRVQAGLTRTLGQLVDTQRTVLAALPASPEAPSNGQRTLFEAPNGEPQNTPKPPAPTAPAPSEKPKKPRRQNGVKKLLRDLKEEKFFAEPRSVEVIRDKLKIKGHTCTPSEIAARLQEMTKDQELYRDQAGEVYVYKDTKFDEVPRPQDAPAEPAE